MVGCKGDLHSIDEGGADADEDEDPETAVVQLFDLVAEDDPVDVGGFEEGDWCEEVEDVHFPVHGERPESALELCVQEEAIFWS